MWEDHAKDGLKTETGRGDVAESWNEEEEDVFHVPLYCLLFTCSGYCIIKSLMNNSQVQTPYLKVTHHPFPHSSNVILITNTVYCLSLIHI